MQDQQILKIQDFYTLLYGIEGYTLTLTHVSILLRGVRSPDFVYS